MATASACMRAARSTSPWAVANRPSAVCTRDVVPPAVNVPAPEPDSAASSRSAAPGRSPWSRSMSPSSSRTQASSSGRPSRRSSSPARSQSARAASAFPERQCALPRLSRMSASSSSAPSSATIASARSHSSIARAQSPRQLASRASQSSACPVPQRSPTAPKSDSTSSSSASASASRPSCRAIREKPSRSSARLHGSACGIRRSRAAPIPPLGGPAIMPQSATPNRCRSGRSSDSTMVRARSQCGESAPGTACSTAITYSSASSSPGSGPSSRRSACGVAWPRRPLSHQYMASAVISRNAVGLSCSTPQRSAACRLALSADSRASHSNCSAR